MKKRIAKRNIFIIILALIATIFCTIFYFHYHTRNKNPNFRCPESYTTEDEYTVALGNYINEEVANNPHITEEELSKKRHELLVANNCATTLQNLLDHLPSGSGTTSAGIINNPSTGFVCMSQADKDRLYEIMEGVIDDKISITDSLKKEFRGIFTKCNTSEKDITWYEVFGPAVTFNYQSLFFPDVLASFKTGVPVKSKDRQTFEDLALSNGSMSTDTIQGFNSDLKKIIKGEPVDLGTKMVFTKQMINDFLVDTQKALSRLDTLFNK